ncbi:MAG TPA: phosphate ABC transporter permease PstA [Bdellovibrionota bacterium]|nr:phosphate ABC transporter permease PstA [Bdellovibrionota bacterium]
MNSSEPQLGATLKRRRILGVAFAAICTLSAFMGVVLLAILLIDLTGDGIQHVTKPFLLNFPSRFPAQAGIKSALFGTLWVMGLTTFFSLPIGIGAGIYLEEFARRSWFSRFIQLNIANLAGVPSIVYGILGLAVFVRGLKFERSVLAGALTMTLLILPTIIIASQEALRAVPKSIRLAAFALGATRWQTTYAHVLPAALPGILTGVILAVSRAMGETAPLIMLGALTYVAFVPTSLNDPFTVLPIQVFNWASRPQPAFHGLAAAGILVLLAVLLTMNALAILLRHRYERKLRW